MTTETVKEATARFGAEFDRLSAEHRRAFKGTRAEWIQTRAIDEGLATLEPVLPKESEEEADIIRRNPLAAGIIEQQQAEAAAAAE